MTDQAFLSLSSQLQQQGVQLVVVSKNRSPEEIKRFYDLGHRDFGENRVQELTTKKDLLPADIRWHMIGHLQRNKVKYIVSFIHMIQSVDSLELLLEIEKRAAKVNRVIPCLLEIHIARESSKYGLTAENARQLLEKLHHQPLPHILIKGLMGMATYTDDTGQIKREFCYLKELFENIKQSGLVNPADFTTLSMGMSGDYQIAIACGSNMVRIGSLIFE